LFVRIFHLIARTAPVALNQAHSDSHSATGLSPREHSRNRQFDARCGFPIPALTRRADPLLVVGKSLGTELLVLGGGLVAMLLLVVGAIGAIWRMVRHGEW
jgi:hypothetical protein